jgi:RNA recognition motif-containing protein
MNIYVGSLAESVTADDLRLAFAGYGTVINAIVMRDTAGGKPLGYGHVYLVPDEAARQAIADLDQVIMRGQPLTVRECVYRSRKDRRVSRLPWRGPERRVNGDRRMSSHPLTRSVASG